MNDQQTQTSTRLRTLLVQPVILTDDKNPKKTVYNPGNEIPLNMLCLSAFLDREMMSNRVIDMRTSRSPFDDLEKTIRDYQPHIVGLTAFSCEIIGAHQAALTAKRIDDSIITVLGGIHGSAIPELTMTDYPAFDLLIRGEGEHTLADLIRHLDSGTSLDSVNGLIHRWNGSVRFNEARALEPNLDSLPFPSRHLIDFKKYYPNPMTYNYCQLPTTGIMASRGCPFNCHYCSKGVWGRGVRFRSARSLFNEMRECVEQYHIRDFRFFDDVFTSLDGPAEEVSQLIIDSGMKITFSCFSRVDYVRPELLGLLKRAGCFHIKYGVESSSPKALLLANRTATTEHAYNAVRMTQQHGILTKCAFMMALPGETEDDYRNTIELCLNLKSDLVSIGLFQLFPGSHYYTEIVEKKNQELIDSLPAPEKALPYISQAYRRFYFRIDFVTNRIKSLVRETSMIPVEIVRFSRGFLSLVWFFIRRTFRTA